MAEVALGVGLPLDRPLDELIEAARAAEDLGYGYVWANDDRLQRDVFSVLAVLGLRTERVRLGPGVTNPYTRHPALIASAVATLDELTGGRAVLGLGAGGTNHAMLGLERVAPATALREAVEVVRTLLAGEEATVEGRVVRARRARLDFRPARRDVPIYLGARGPLSLRLAGQVADGAIVGNLASVEAWRYALRHIRDGAARAGRDPRALRLVAWLYCSIADDGAAAVDAVRPMVATSLVTSRPILHEIGVELPPGFAEVMDAAGWTPSREAAGRAADTVPDELVHRFALAGRPEECRARLHALLQAVPEIGQVAVVPLPVEGKRLPDVILRFAVEVAGDLAAGPPSKVSGPPASRSG